MLNKETTFNVMEFLLASAMLLTDEPRLEAVILAVGGYGVHEVTGNVQVSGA